MDMDKELIELLELNPEVNRIFDELYDEDCSDAWEVYWMAYYEYYDSTADERDCLTEIEELIAKIKRKYCND